MTHLLILRSMVYTDLIISTIVDGYSLMLDDNTSLYGLDNFYYRRFFYSPCSSLYCLYGLDNFYYRRYNQISLGASLSIRT